VRRFPPEAAPGQVLLFAHRGFSSVAPENTLAAFEAALHHGFPGVELDVHASRDRRLLVTHDHNLRRVTGRDALVEERTAAEVRELDAGAWFGDAFRGERVPFLDEVFELLGPRVYYDVELKWGERRSGGFEAQVLERIRAHALEDRCLISSFNPYCIRAVRALDREQPTAHIYADDPEVPRVLRRGEARWFLPTPYIKPRHDQVHRWSAALYRTALPSRIIAWTVDDPSEARRLLGLGVHGIISNRPERITPVLRDFADSRGV
jgi:glycerophosphoryl diester phosphodiesterase